MKIEYEIAGQHRRTELENFIEANPAMEVEAAKAAWIDSKFGSWVRKNVTEDFTIYELTPLGFRIDLPQPAHALLFIQKLGGRSLEEI